MRAEFVSFVSGLFLLTGCGYTFQRAQSTVYEKQGVRKIFVAPLLNNTYKAGAENLLYNAAVKKIAMFRSFTIVSHQEDADAILKGRVTAADYGVDGSTAANQLFGNDKIPAERHVSSGISVATGYSATLGCSFSLIRLVDNKEGTGLWAGSFSKSLHFPANNQLDVFGTTSALINESEFERALRDLADSEMGDLYESMFMQF